MSATGDIVVTEGTSVGALTRINPSTGMASLLSFGLNLDALEHLDREPDGNFVVDDRGSARVVRVNATSGAQTVVTSGNLLSAPSGISVDQMGGILVADPNASGGSGAVILIAPATGAQSAMSSHGFFVDPRALTVY